MAERNAILYDYFSAFGLGRVSGLGLPGESPGILAARRGLEPLAAVHVAFGQGLSVNAIQATSVYATIANEGVRVTPTLIKGYVDGNGKYTAAATPARTQVVSAKDREGGLADDGIRRLGCRNRYLRADPGLPRRRQDRHREPLRGQLRRLLRIHRLLHRIRARRQSAAGDRGVRGWARRAPTTSAARSPPRFFQKVMSYALQEQGVPPTGTAAPGLPITW